ncbi:unnamed protein product [Caenorhabditis nigoni]
MHFKHAFIAFLLVLLVGNFDGVQAAIPEYPLCLDRGSKGVAKEPTYFLFLIDKLIGDDVLPRLQYLLRSIACELPNDEKVRSMAMSYADNQYTNTEYIHKEDVYEELYRPIDSSGKDESTPCSRFTKAIGRSPPGALDKPNIQFIVPIFQHPKDAPNCFVKAFQTQFKEDPRKENFYLNGMLINAEYTKENAQSVRLLIPNLEAAVNLTKPSLYSDDNILHVTDSGRLVQSYSDMLRSILAGDNTRDWDEDWVLPPDLFKTSTLAPSTSGSTTLNTTTTTVVPETSSISQNATEVLDNGYFFGAMGGDEDNTTVTPSRRSIDKLLIVNATTTVTPNYTTTVGRRNEVADYEAHEEPVDDLEEMGLAAGSKGQNGTGPNGHYRVAPEGFQRRKEIDADLLIYILILLFIIWCFCILLCLIWIFFCAKKKRAKLEDEADERAKLLQPIMDYHGSDPPPEPTAPKLSTSNESGEDEVDDEWKNIQPAKYTDSTVSTNQSKSEIESVKQPAPAKQIAPVEVSEFENHLDDEMDHRPRHGGYLETKRTAELHFD